MVKQAAQAVLHTAWAAWASAGVGDRVRQKLVTDVVQEVQQAVAGIRVDGDPPMNLVQQGVQTALLGVLTALCGCRRPSRERSRARKVLAVSAFRRRRGDDDVGLGGGNGEG
jgi:predicted secreted Zn-dependent protease